MKSFIGYYIVGATSRENAEKEKGLCLWSDTKPNWFVRFMNRYFLNIYWVDKVKVQHQKGDNLQNADALTSYTKEAPLKKNFKAKKPKSIS
jgi:hypothetical protein